MIKGDKSFVFKTPVVHCLSPKPFYVNHNDYTCSFLRQVCSRISFYLQIQVGYLTHAAASLMKTDELSWIKYLGKYTILWRFIHVIGYIDTIILQINYCSISTFSMWKDSCYRSSFSTKITNTFCYWTWSSNLQ